MSAVLTLLSRAYCGLCETMEQELAPIAAQHGASVRVIDVDADSALVDRWGDFVPVLFLGEPGEGIELCHYHLDAHRVATALAAEDGSRSPQPAGAPRIR